MKNPSCIKTRENLSSQDRVHFTSHQVFFLEYIKREVDAKSNTTSEWNQTCKNLIRFLQDRISNKSRRRREAVVQFSSMNHDFINTN